MKLSVILPFLLVATAAGQSTVAELEALATQAELEASALRAEADAAALRIEADAAAAAAVAAKPVEPAPPVRSVQSTQSTQSSQSGTPAPFVGKTGPSFRVGLAINTLSDDFDLVEQVDLEELAGLVVQWTAPFSPDDPSLRWLVGLSITGASGDFGVSAARFELDLGAEKRWGSSKGFFFVQGGLGLASAQLEDDFDSYSGDGIGVFLGAGAEVAVNESVGLFAMFRPLEPEISFDGDLEGLDVASRSLMIGLSFTH